jgi:hypothetical protein
VPIKVFSPAHALIDGNNTANARATDLVLFCMTTSPLRFFQWRRAVMAIDHDGRRLARLDKPVCETGHTGRQIAEDGQQFYLALERSSHISLDDFVSKRK